MTIVPMLTSRPMSVRLACGATAALLPWLAFLAAGVLVDGNTAGAARAAPLYLLFIGIPSVLPLVAARRALVGIVVLLVVTGVAAVAGALVAASDDAQAGLNALLVHMIAFPLAGVVFAGEAVVDRRHADDGGGRARVSDRLAALLVDVAVASAALVVPLTALSRAGLEIVAAVIGVVAATVYFGGLLGPGGRTAGHWALRLEVVDARTMAPPAAWRAFARGLVLVIEVASAITFLGVLPLAELVSAWVTGRSLTDRGLRTVVVTVPRPLERQKRALPCHGTAEGAD